MPGWTAELRSRLAGLRLNPAREAEIVDELSTHLEDRYQDLVAGGATADRARGLALAELSDADVLARAMRPLKQAHAVEMKPLGAPRQQLLGDLWRDLVYGARMFRREPGFAAAVVITLALGIGANTAVFSLVNATLLQRLPVSHPERLAYVFNGSTASSVFSYPAYADLRDGTDAFESFAAWGGITASLNANGDTDLVTGAIVTGNFFETLGVRAAMGRLLTRQDDLTPGAHPVAVVSDTLWRGRFGSRPDIINHEILMNGHRFTIVGVTPAGFTGAQLGVLRDVYVPMMMQAVMRPPRAGFSGDMNPDLLKVRTNNWLFAIGRLTSGVTPAQASASLTRLATTLDRANDAASREHPISAIAVDDGIPGQRAQVVPVARLLTAVVGAVLLIGCANVANLLLSRAASRRREIAVRLAMGASRWRLVRQLLTESVLLSLAGGAAGVGLAWAVVAAFRAAPPPPGALPIALGFTLDMRVLSFSLALSIVTGILFGLAPALRASRPGLVPALKDDSFVPDERSRRFNLKKGLVVFEVALSLMLLVGAGLFVRSLRAIRSVSSGINIDSVVSAQLNVNLLRYTRAQGQAFYREIVDRVEAVPGVQSATVARITPLSGGGRVMSLHVQGRDGTAERFQSEGGDMRANGRDSTFANVVGPRFFKTMGIALMDGRDFSELDASEATPVVIVSQTLANREFAGRAVGQRLSVTGPNGPWRDIVGVVSDSKYATLEEAPAPVVYMPLSQNHETGMVLLVNAGVDPRTLSGPIRREIRALEPNLPVPTVQTMHDTVATSLYAARMGAGLLAVFGGLAILLAAVGIYGVLAFLVARRTREIGIRVALGASRRDVFGLVVGEGLTLVIAGAVIGLGAAAYLVRFVSTLLYGIQPLDVATFVAMPVVLAVVGLVACLTPARRAMNVDPTVALKSN
jgi:putative ABC transport system permease protein